LKAPAVPVVLNGCVVAQENPHALLLEVVTSLVFPFLTDMPFAGLLQGIFSETPPLFYS
jgi:hypothetical protein